MGIPASMATVFNGMYAGVYHAVLEGRNGADTICFNKTLFYVIQ